MKGGLQDLSISRSSFDWGIPVPWDEGHVFYVWADALIAYLTGIGYGDSEREAEFDRRWPIQYHFVGKDITRFHCVIWPAMLIRRHAHHAHGVRPRLPLTTRKCRSRRATAYAGRLEGARVRWDAYRYYFAGATCSFNTTVPSPWNARCKVYNADLANTWGNLVSRVTNMTTKYFEGRVPEAPAEAADNPLREIADGLYAEYDACMVEVRHTGADGRAEAQRKTTPYVEESAPWTLAKDPARADELAGVIYNCLEAIRIIALYMAPFMPNTSAEVFRRLGLGEIADTTDIQEATAWGQLPASVAVEVGDPLFPRLDVDNQPEL